MFRASLTARLAAAALFALPLAVPVANAETSLTIAVMRDSNSVAENNFTLTTRGPAAQVVETAVQPDENFLPQPLLFDSWDYADGIYTITVHPGIRFSDGSAFNADTAIAALRLNDLRKSDFLEIDPESFVKLDEMRFSFRSEKNSALVIENMTHRGTSLFADTGDRAANLVGTGPYLLESYDPKVSMTVVRNPDYWGTPRNIDRITYRYMADDNARILALQNGEIDIIADVTPQMMLSMPQDGSVVLHESRPIRYLALSVGINAPAPFDILKDVTLRQAVAWAIDREAIAEVLFDGRGVPAKGILPGWMFGLGEDHTDGFGYDPEKAAALMDAAGWKLGADGVREKEGRKMKLRLVAAYPNVTTVKPVPEMVQQMLIGVGIDIELIEVDDAGVYDDTYLEPGQGDLFIEMGSNNNTDPTYLLSMLYTTTTPWTGYRTLAPGPHVDALLADARNAQTREVVIEKVRAAHRAIVQDDLVTIPILLVPNFVLSRPGLEIPMSEFTDWIDYGMTRVVAE